MTVLVVGHGSREFALLKRLRLEGTKTVHLTERKWPETPASQTILCTEYDPVTTAAAASDLRCSAAVVNLEDLLRRGAVKRLHGAGVLCFGVDENYAWLEYDKLRAKALVDSTGTMNVPETAAAPTLAEIDRFIGKHGLPVVLKFRNAFGRSEVLIAKDSRSLVAAKAAWQTRSVAHETTIERFVTGEEFTVVAFIRGEITCFPLVVRDYPFLQDSDAGPKTGGMGSVSGPEFEASLGRTAINQACNCIRAVAHELCRQGAGYEGTLCGQFRLNGNQLWFIEFDVRLGDPEIANLLWGTAISALDLAHCVLPIIEKPAADKAIVSICAVPTGYPRLARDKRLEIERELLIDDCVLIGDLNATSPDHINSGKGRALTVIGCGGLVEQARSAALKIMERLPPDLHYRSDVGLLSMRRPEFTA